MRKKEILNLFFKKCFLNKRFFPAGTSCIYVQLKNNLGVKCYVDDSYNRNFSFKNQVFLNELELAPKAFFKFELYNPFIGEKVYCYVTEHAKKCAKKTFFKYKKKLVLELEENGFSSHDIFQRNCGLIRGRLVLVDCDINSLT